MIKKALIVLLLVMLLLFLVIVGGSFYLLGTDSGFKWTAKKLEASVAGLSIGDTTGNLESGINTNSIAWKRDGIAVDITDLTSTWSSGCLIKYTYCLDKLNIDVLRIKIRPDGQSSKASSGKIKLPNIVLPLDIDADEITISKLILDTAEGNTPVILDNLQLKARASGSDISIDWLIANYKNYSIRVKGDVALQGDYPIRGTVNATARDIIVGKNISASLNISESLRELAVNGYVTGGIKARLAGTIKLLETGLPLDLQANWDANGWPLDTFETVRSTDATLKLQGTLHDYAIELSTIIDGDQVPVTKVQLTGTVNPQRALFPTVNLFLLDGLATGSAAVSWTDNVAWVADLIAKELNPGVKWPDMFGNLNALIKANGFAGNGTWTLNLPTGKVDGSLRNFPFTLNTRLSKNVDDVWNISNLDLNNGPNNLMLAGSYGEELDLTTSINFPAVHYLIPSIAGNLTADAKITGQLTEPTVDLTAKSSLLTSAGILVRGAELETQVTKAAIDQSMLALSVAILNNNGQEFKKLDIGLDGTRASHTLAAAVNSLKNTRVQLTASGSLSDDYDWLGQLESGLINLPAHVLTLTKPAKLDWDNTQKKFGIDQNCWAHNEARLCLTNRITADQSGNAKISLRNYSLDSLNTLLPTTAQITGQLNSNTDLSWSDKGAAFTADLRASIADGVITVKDKSRRTHQFNYQSLVLNTQADPYTIKTDIYLKSNAVGNGRVALTLNTKNPDKAILGEVSLTGFDIGFLKAFLPELDDIGGIGSIDGEVSGTMTSPKFLGKINLADPVVQSATLPLSIDGGDISLDILGDHADVNGILNSGDGIVTLGGDIAWPGNKPEIKLTIDGENLVIVQNPVIHSVVNPALTLDYRRNRLAIAGAVQIPSADINIKQLPSGTTALSSDVVIIEEEHKQTEETASLDLQVDVNVNLGNDINLTGYGLEARLTGDFNVKKRASDPPQLIGEITVIEGFYKSYGQDLAIKNGQILFVGPIERTTLSIDAVREITAEDRIAGLRLTGPIADPAVTLFTEPADKTQESILSYIVLGRDLGDDNSNSESTLLATAALALTIKEGKGFATGFAESLGIDDFTVEADGSGDDTQVVLSGRLSSKLLLRYGRSVFVPEQTLFLRYDLSRRLYLEAAQGLERAVDLFYSFSF